jgi:hypothetical protein
LVWDGPGKSHTFALESAISIDKKGPGWYCSVR